MKQIRLPFGRRTWRCYTKKEIDRFEEWWRADGPLWGAVDPAQEVQIRSVRSAESAGPGRIKIVGVGEVLTLRNAAIRRLYVQSVPVLDIENCHIGEIAVQQTANYQIKNSMIGNFIVVKEREKDKDKDERGHYVQDLSWEGGYLGHFDLHQDKTRAFVGDVSLHRVTLPPTAEPYRMQWLRDAREAFTARNNLIAAGIFHTSELKLYRRNGGLAYLLTSWGYQLGSNFGNSIGRPFGWLLFFLVAIGVVAYCSGTEPNLKASAAWFATLKSSRWWPEVLRAGVYSAQSVLNPLNLFVTEPLVSLSNGWGAAAGLLLGIFGIASLALLLLSFRRRFKLE